jgi:hypothetical protein
MPAAFLKAVGIDTNDILGVCDNSDMKSEKY